MKCAYNFIPNRLLTSYSLVAPPHTPKSPLLFIAEFTSRTHEHGPSCALFHEKPLWSVGRNAQASHGHHAVQQCLTCLLSAACRLPELHRAPLHTVSAFKMSQAEFDNLDAEFAELLGVSNHQITLRVAWISCCTPTLWHLWNQQYGTCAA